MEKRLLLIRKR